MPRSEARAKAERYAKLCGFDCIAEILEDSRGNPRISEIARMELALELAYLAGHAAGRKAGREEAAVPMREE